MLWLAIAYPLLAHAAILTGEPRLMWLALEILTIVSIGGALAKWRPWAWITLFVLSIALYLLTTAGGGHYLLYVPPIAIPLFLLIVFARSLSPGETPIVTRVAVAARGPLPPDLDRYARGVTQVWVVSFAVLAITAFLLALLAPPAIWSWATNFFQYLVIGAIFFIEYVYRRWRFRHHTHPGIREYLRILVNANFRAH
jgi:uncharacterized membrane protein